MIAKKISTLLNHQTTRVKSVDFHPVKPIFIIGLHDGRIQAWDYNSNACIHEFIDNKTIEQGSVRSIKFHPHGDIFLSCGDDKLIRMWDYTKRKLLKVFKGHTDFIRSSDFHPTKSWIISSSDDQTIKVWNFMTGKCLATAIGHSHYVMSAKFLDDDLIISGSLDNTIRVWDCKNLLEKTNKFVPSIIVKQIIQGHDRGINFIEIVHDNNDLLILSGGDDREIKVWGYRNELFERETIFAHQGCVSKAILHQNDICSVGEDGLFCIFNLKSKKSVKYFVEGRFWTLACKNGIFVVGHDNGFDILEYLEPKLVVSNDLGCYYLKNNYFYFSDLSIEKKICKAEGEVLSIHCIDKFFLIKFYNEYEIYEVNKKIYKSQGSGIFLYDDDLLIVDKKDKQIYIKDRNNNCIRTFDASEGLLLFGDKNNFFISNNNFILKYSKDGFIDTVNLGFSCDRVVVSQFGDYYAFLSKNFIAIYDRNLNLINQDNEIVNIKGGFFYEDIFIYSTSKHLKYIFVEQGVLLSVDNIMYPFYYKDNLIFYISEEGIESIEVDITEIKFKKEVMNNGNIENINEIIKSGSLPGLSPLAFLIKKHKGDIALPYIKNIRQRFELCLSTGKFEECLKYCEDTKNIQMYQKLSKMAIESSIFEISEKCLIFLKEWYDLFLLYVCTNKIDKLKDLKNICDEHTENIISLFLEDSSYFHFDLSKLQISNKILSNDLLADVRYEKVNLEFSYNEGYDCVTKGDFIKALDHFENCLYTIASDCKHETYKKDLRIKLGIYISGIKIHLCRKKEEDLRKQIVYAKYFANLDLSDEHKKLADLEFINVCYKNGNYKDAKKRAKYFNKENKPKIIKKVLKLEENSNKYDIPNGVFCYDVKEYVETSKECSFCYVKSENGEICTLCKIGFLLH